MLLSSLKIFSVWRIESKKNREDSEEYLEIKSNKRIYRVLPSEIKFIEGMGNYLTTYLVNRKPLIVYMSLKEMKSILPEKFVRIHKSFIINKNLIDSYNNESVEIDDRIIPIGKSFNGQEL
ncbi:LytTR family transcriptional regulator DNA-binding domain-containing protein [uncultured Croceitalea sp.]|uniref:LytR/AlgR family response regulator transcription factor n=1 Tax=uncultured Croceitalea sp. TaxID=1798908 RepID=UPI003305AE59